MSVDEPQVHRRPPKSASALQATPSKEPALSSPTGPTRSDSRGVSALVRNSSKYAFGAIIFLSFLTRYWKIWDPAQVVFDEVHFGKFASYYLRRQYYFDVHPPLAKMMIALGGWLVGYDGHFLFEKIGMDYVSNGVPYIMLRGWVAIFGFALPPLVYMIMAESGYSVMASLLAGLLVTFDNALVTQGRLILLDNIMIFFMLAAVYAYIKFFKLRYKPFGAQWWTWLLATGAMLGCVVSCKLVGLFTITLIGSAVIYDLWRIIDIRRGTTMTQFAHHFIARAVALIAVPFAVYLAFFYVHFAVLTNTGTGDVYHTPKFQMQLRDNFMTKSSFDVHYGDRITFKHRETNVYLESSEARYPLRYEDKRISSQGQQVTGAKKLSDNGFWTIKPARDYAEFTEFLQRRRAGEETSEELERWRVMNTDIVHLQHVTTGTYLRTHDVASPMTPTNMEFTTVLLNSTLEENAPEIYEDTLWELMIDGTSDNSTQLRTSSSFVRLVSKKHGVSMWTHKKALPEWGHGNQEINGNKKPNEKSNLWTVTQIHGRKTSDEEKAEMVKRVEPMGFLAKFAELQGLMIKHNNALTTVHPFQSTPLSWPFLTRGISFWTNAAERKQIYLLGNPVGWWLSDIALVVYAVVMVALELANRRNEEIVDGVVSRHMARSTGFITFAWIIHYFPFFLMGRSLFLHHFLPASIFGYMVLASCFQFFCVHDYQRFALRNWGGRARAFMPSVTALVVFLAIVVVQIVTFEYFAPLTYGTPLTVEQVNARRWLSSYDLQFQK